MAQAKKTEKDDAKEVAAKKTASTKSADKDEIQSDHTEVETTTSKQTAKAGKRSAKSVKEAQDKQAKEERKLTKDETKPELKPAIKPARTLLERRSKSYRDKHTLIDKNKNYSLEEASQLIGQTNPVKFDATVELHIRLEVDPRQADQNVRDNVLLPAGSGKTVRVAAFVDSDGLSAAKAAGADLAGETDIIKELEAGSFSFDILVATPAQMPKLGKYARVLGPRGLMPNPKSGTVTTDIAKAISEAKAGKVEYRVDSGGNVHLGIGKASFKPAQLLENLQAVLNSIQSNKPSSVKGTYIISAYLSTSMGPSIKLAL